MTESHTVIRARRMLAVSWNSNALRDFLENFNSRVLVPPKQCFHKTISDSSRSSSDRKAPSDDREETLVPFSTCQTWGRVSFRPRKCRDCGRKESRTRVSKDAPSREASPSTPPNLNLPPTEISAIIYLFLDENSVVLLSLATKKLYADYYFAFPSPPKPILNHMRLIDPILSIIKNRPPPLFLLLKTWMGPNYHYKLRTNTFLNNATFPPDSRQEWELERMYMDYYTSQFLLPRPYEMGKGLWEEECERVIGNCGLRKRSYVKWLEYWGVTDVFQRIRRRRGFVVGVGKKRKKTENGSARKKAKTV